ncbi:MAG: hypothetical protein ACK56H_13015 [Novosphingobium sp.]
MANTNRKPAKGKPISSHPLFPAVVALWFGALFGLGSLAIRPTLIEDVVLKIGLDLIVPAAAPPLGVTARILIALIMASLGAALGAMLTLRINRPKTVARERKRSAANPGAAAEAEAAMWNKRDVFTDGPARRPISAYEELGETMDSQNLLVGRRRALAVEHEDQQFQPQEIAPLPGGEPQIFDIAASRLAPVSLNDSPNPELTQLDLGAFPAPGSVEPAAPMPLPSPMIEREVPVVAEAPRIFDVVAEDGHVPVDFVRAAGFRTSVFETEPAQPLFADRPETPAAAPIDPQPVSAEAPAPLPVAEPLPSPAGLEMTDLAKRLQESMARRRAAKAQPAEMPQAAPVAAEAAPAAPVAAEPAFVPPPPIVEIAAPDPVTAPVIPPAPIPMPAALRPVSFDHHDDNHADLVGLMPRHLSMPVPAPVAPAVIEFAAVEPPVEPEVEVEAEIEAVPEEAIASLLSIEMPRQEFVRIDEPEEPVANIEPVVIFPGQIAAAPVTPLRPFDGPAAAMHGAPVAAAQAVPAVDPAEAERALRLALANLQRISGAA